MQRLFTLAAAQMGPVGPTESRKTAFDFGKNRRSEHYGMIIDRADRIGR